MPIDNGIGQGDPLSMILYIIYNADLIEIAEGNDKESIGYVDDAMAIAIGNDFHKTTTKIENIMSREGGAFNWSRAHNSNFEISKLAIIHASPKHHRHLRTKQYERYPRLRLMLRGTDIIEVESYKHLSIHIDYKLD